VHCPCCLTKEYLVKFPKPTIFTRSKVQYEGAGRQPLLQEPKSNRSLKAERYIAYSSFTMVVFSDTYTPSKNFRMSFFLTWHDMLMSAADLLTSSMSLPEITSSSLTFVDRTILTPETCKPNVQLKDLMPLTNRDTSRPFVSNANAKHWHCEHTNCSVHCLRHCGTGVKVFQCKMANQSS